MTKEKKKIISMKDNLKFIKCWIVARLNIENFIDYQAKKVVKLSKKDFVTIRIGESTCEYKERLEYEKIALESINKKPITPIFIPAVGLLTVLVTIFSFVLSVLSNSVTTLVKITEISDEINKVPLEEQKKHIQNLIDSVKGNLDFASWSTNYLMEIWKWIAIIIFTLIVIDFFIIFNNEKRERKIMIDLINLELRKLEEMEIK